MPLPFASPPLRSGPKAKHFVFQPFRCASGPQHFAVVPLHCAFEPKWTNKNPLVSGSETLPRGFGSKWFDGQARARGAEALGLRAKYRPRLSATALRPGTLALLALTALYTSNEATRASLRTAIRV